MYELIGELSVLVGVFIGIPLAAWFISRSARTPWQVEIHDRRDDPPGK